MKTAPNVKDAVAVTGGPRQGEFGTVHQVKDGQAYLLLAEVDQGTMKETGRHLWGWWDFADLTHAGRCAVCGHYRSEEDGEHIMPCDCGRNPDCMHGSIFYCDECRDADRWFPSREDLLSTDPRI